MVHVIGDRIAYGLSSFTTNNLNVYIAVVNMSVFFNV
jgi:hypothetical protein